MRVCLYLEAENAVARSGFKRAFESHKKALKLADVEVTTDPGEVDYDLLHLHAFGPRSLYYMGWAKREGIKVVVHAHSVGAHDFRDSFTMSNLIAPIYERYLTFFYEQSDAVFTPTAFARDLLLQMGLDKRIAVVSGGVDRESFRFSREKRAGFRSRYELRRFTPFTAGNVIPRKGVVDFIRVAERLPQFDFVWYGHRWPRALVFQPKMEQVLTERPPNVIMPGYVADACGAFAAGDVLFFPSHTETQGLVILEAASLGRPLLVRDLPVYRDWLVHGVNCLKARTRRAFIAHLVRLSQDKALYRRLTQGALAHAEAHSLEAVGRKLKVLYRKVLEQPARPRPGRWPGARGRRRSARAPLHDDLGRHPGL